MRIQTGSEPIYELRIRVRDYEVDSQGIVNNANYLHYFEHTRHEFCRMAGTTFAAMQADGLDPVVRRIEVDYMSPLRLGDMMVSRLWFFRNGPRFMFRQEIVREADGALCASGLVTIVCLENGSLTRGDKLAEAFARYLD